MTRVAAAEQYLLDTNAVIALMKGNARFIEQIKMHQPGEIYISSITLHELYFGAYKSQRRDENLARLGLLNLQVLQFDEQDALSSGMARARLSAAGAPIGPLDVLIAGVALARRLCLITHNISEFQRVEGLRVSDWE